MQSSTAANSTEISVGFYAVAYQLPDGSIIISYRGTTPSITLLDAWNGWGVGAGSPYGAQAQLAIGFYQLVAETFPGATISVTGHSLGGGLAGLVASLYGLSATIFDSMNFQTAASQAYQLAIGTPATSTSIETPPDTALYNILYPTSGLWSPQPPNFSGVSAYAVNGEILSSLGIGVGKMGTGQILNPAGQVTNIPSPLPGGNAVDLHSQALLVCLLYASENGLTVWQNIGTDSWGDSPLLAAMFNESIGTALGFVTGSNGQTPVDDPAAQMLIEIAYSALSSGTMPFGDTGVPALFAGADALGQVYGGSTPPSAFLTGIKDDLADIDVEYAGWLAQNADENPLNDVGDIQDNSGALTIDLSSATWSTSCGLEPTTIVGVADIITQAIADSGATAEINAEIQQIWNNSTTQIDRILIGTGAGYVTLNATAQGDLTSSEGALIVANDGGDSITGTSGDDLIIGGAGDDVINVGSGSDIVYAGGGDDTIVFTASSSASSSSIDFIDGGTGQNTVEFNSGVAGQGVDLTLSTVNGPNGIELQVSGPGFATVDMTNIQTIELDDAGDVVSIGANFQTLPQTVTIEGVLQPEGAAPDTLDLSDYSHAPETFQTASGAESFGGVDMQGDTLVSANITVSNFEILDGTNDGDYLNNVSGFKNINLGNGDNYVGNLTGAVLPGDQSEGAEADWVLLNMGSGASTLAGSIPAGSVVNLGAGNLGDQINLSPDTEINGANSTTAFYMNGVQLTGAVQNTQSATPWLINPYTQTMYMLDAGGVLEVRPEWAGTGATFDGVDPSTFITGFANSPYASQPTTGNIHLVSYALVAGNPFTGSYPVPPPGGVQVSVYQLFLQDIPQAEFGVQWGNYSDPMVFDLSGNGIALSPVDSGAAPQVDLDDTEFSMPVSWVDGEEGILVELNPDGTVTSGANFVGGPTGDGFVPLAAYDANGDGVIDDADLDSAADADLPQLRIWVDSNGDGVMNANDSTYARLGVFVRYALNENRTILAAREA